MNTKRRTLIGYIQALPRLSVKEQQRAMTDAGVGIVHVEGRRVHLNLITETIERFITHVRPGDVVALYRVRVLAPHGDRLARRKMRGYFDAIEARGERKNPVHIYELSTGRCSRDKRSRDMMMRDAEDELSGRATREGRAGRPAKPFTDEERSVVERHWPSTRHKTNEAALDAIRAEALRLGLTRLSGITGSQIAKRVGPSGRAMLKPKKSKR